MSNFKCDKCGMINVDCGLGVFKTPREIELEARVKELEEKLARKTQEYEDLKFCMESLSFKYKKCYSALEEINGLIQSILDDFEEDSIDQQLEFSKQIGMNILDIISKTKGAMDE